MEADDAPQGPDWSWEQDPQFRFTRAMSPDAHEEQGLSAWIGARRWDLPGATALTLTWEEHRAMLSARLPFHDFQFVWDRDGQPCCVSCSGRPRFDGDGRFMGYQGTARDVTASWRQRARLEDAQALLGVAAALGRFGAWSVELPSGLVRWTDQARAIHEAPLSRECEVQDVLEMYAPEHRALLLDAFQRCVREGTPYDIEVQALTASRQRVWVRVIGVAVRNAAGRTLRVQGAYQDVHKARQLAEEHRNHSEELERRVRDRTEALQRLNQELSAFTVAVAHDLRAPLAGLSGFCRALAEHLAPARDATAAHYLSRIQAGATRMDELLAGLLELSRIGRAPLAVRQVDLSALARDTVESLRAAAPEREVQVEVQDGLAVHGDTRLLRTLVENLLGNAWKFTTACAAACIAFGRDPHGSFFVRDNGAGFDMAYAADLFAPFRRLHGEDEFQGLGIGLASARRVVERHGGRIWAESAPGAGTTLRFTLAADPAGWQPAGRS